ncbi:hypothetical protein [Agromyces aerolatus]|uniref:hypothetical protein n=1 Tax=Agromyces sp. LY-1074 TaxID=3074080 RepID=UPI00285C6DB4|nr:MULTISPECIES: hypothetical protein [unclassified Agromyces]MDR5699358.1 hypothetical protein [Agromyces sp. LY-1074]MDR5705654.1 hypothetical protein [Agromyces sp. LY-1358]
MTVITLEQTKRRRTPGRSRRAAFAALAIGATVLGALAFPGAANAAPNDATISFGDGTIVGGGVAAEVPVTVTCDPAVALQRAVGLEIRQATPVIVTGELIGLVSCTGRPVTVTFRVFATPAGFQPGVAWGAVFTLTDDETDVVVVEHELQLN